MVVREIHYPACTSGLFLCPVIKNTQLHEILHKQNKLGVVDGCVPIVLTWSLFVNQCDSENQEWVHYV